MIDLKQLLEGLPIEVKGKDEVELYGVTYYQSQMQFAIKSTDCSPLVRFAGCIILALMDAHEEPVNQTRTFLPLCEKHGCQLVLSVYERPGSPPGSGWSCPECVKERELKPAEKPWEPGTVVKSINDLWTARLDEFVSFAENGDERWKFTVFNSGATGEQYFTRKNWTIHRLPHEFKVGEDYAENGTGYTFLVKHSRNGMIGDGTGAFWNAKGCCHVPAPKEAKHEAEKIQRPDLFQGPHWQAAEIWPNKNNATAQCLLDLRDELRRVRAQAAPYPWEDK